MYLEKYLIEIEKLCRKYDVKKLDVFGSVLTEGFGVQSDIDMIVDIISDDPIDYAEKYFMLKFDLQDLLKRNIDLLEYKSLINPYILRNIDLTKTVIYAA